MVLDASFFKEEERCGYLVTEKRKKVWAVGLELWERFDEVCKKHGITYYAYYGTLLGAVRHQGFIPWDDDIDVIMFRDEYKRFQEIAPSEFTEPYFFQNAYTDRIIWQISKIRDSRTTAIERNFLSLKDTVHQGIFLDIFPFDSVADGIHSEFCVIEEIRNLLWRMVMEPVTVLRELQSGAEFLLKPEFILELYQKGMKESFRVFEAFSEEHFGETEDVNYLLNDMTGKHSQCVKKEWFQNIIYLPFEHIQLPVPAEYDKILTRRYGDYHQLVPGGSDHEGVILEPDIPYKEYFEKYL